MRSQKNEIKEDPKTVIGGVPPTPNQEPTLNIYDYKSIYGHKWLWHRRTLQNYYLTNN